MAVDTALMNERPNMTLVAELRLGQALQDAKTKLSKNDWDELLAYYNGAFGSEVHYMSLAAAYKVLDDEQVSVERVQKGFRQFVRNSYNPKWERFTERTKRSELPTYVKSAVTQEDLVLIMLKAEYRNKKARREQRPTRAELEYYELCLSRVTTLANVLEHASKRSHSNRMLSLALRDIAVMLASKS